MMSHKYVMKENVIFDLVFLHFYFKYLLQQEDLI